MRSNLEEELAWRQEELAFFKNQLCNISNDNDKEKYRKSLILMLYSHFEGFTKISLQTYIQYINSQQIERNKVNANIIAASMRKELNAYDSLDKKSKVFKRKLPDDTVLHRFARRVDLIASMEDFKSQTVQIEDDIIDTESNMWYIVLKKNLYKVGLPLDVFEPFERNIDKLVNKRNGIAHGGSRLGVSESEYIELETAIYNVMSNITRILFDYANNNKFLL